MAPNGNGRRDFEAGAIAAATENMADVKPKPEQSSIKASQTYNEAEKANAKRPSLSSLSIPLWRWKSPVTSPSSTTASATASNARSKQWEDRFLEAMEMANGPEDEWPRMTSRKWK